MLCIALVGYLLAMGFSARGVCRASEVLDVALAFRPETLLIDYHLGETVGTELAKEIAARVHIRRIVVLSATLTAPEDLGEFKFWEKNLPLPELLRRLDEDA